MLDSIPSDHKHKRAHTDVAAVCAAALGVSIETFTAERACAIAAGHAEGEADGIAFLAIKDSRFGVRGAGGVEPEDASRAAAFRGSPRRERDADGRRASALARLGAGLDWQSQVIGDYQYRAPVVTDPAVGKLGKRLGVPPVEALRRLTIRWCLQQQARRQWPAERSRGAKRRRRFVRERLAALGYWPDLSQQLYLPSPARASAVAQPRRAHLINKGRRRAIAATRRDARQVGFTGNGWETAS